MMKTEVGIAFVRLVVGVIFIAHGLDKFNGGIEGTVAFFESISIPSPDIMAVVVALVEIIAGLALVLGLLTRLMSAILMIVMIGAVYMVKFDQGFIGGFEFDLLLFAVLLLFVVNGSHFMAVDGFLTKKKKRQRFGRR
ncbi:MULTISPECIES: DoxX family protein [Bacillaceae]|uniref:Oxidoreductase n=1 Tax=Alkalicoccobacillus plakortidis TaxID=444060 RepID=A0A9D5DMN1_9BACI|nr:MULTISPECIES: DoxX family protein [Bacillaceae]KQL55683.1 oxidoreductase [Alkalicoccobacillus plakortidis]